MPPLNAGMGAERSLEPLSSSDAEPYAVSDRGRVSRRDLIRTSGWRFLICEKIG